MPHFILEKNTKEKIINIFDDLKIDIFFILKKLEINLYNFDQYSFLEKIINNYQYNEPLFLNDVEQKLSLSQYQNLSFLKEIYSNLNDEEYYNNVSENYYHKELKDLFLCTRTCFVLQNNLLNFEHKKYGFDDTHTMFYAIEAFLISSSPINDNRVVKKEFENCFYVYDSHVHGDFRLSKYDTSIRTMKTSLFDYSLPFSIAKLDGTISGYHSIEHSVLSTFLYFLKCGDVKSSFIENFETEFSKLFSKDQVFGNFADAGIVDHFSITFAICGLKYDKPPRLHSEYDMTYESEILNNKLVITSVLGDKRKKTFEILPSELNDLIIGLFEKVHNGNGRSSSDILKKTVEIYFKIINKEDVFE